MQVERVVYEATEKQSQFHASPAMYKLYGGAMGGGKTWALCAEAIALSCDYPGNRGYTCRHTNKDFMRTTYLILDKMLRETDFVAKHYKTQPAYYELWNGSRIYYGGLGDDVKAIHGLRSMELGWFAIDEASETSESFFLMLSSRLRSQIPGIKYFGLLGSNPDPGWLKRRFIDQVLPDHEFIPALPTDNPNLPLGYVERLREIFPEDWINRFLKGDWTAFEGINNVYPFGAIQDATERNLEPGKPIELGGDIARYGDDESVSVLRRGPKVGMLWRKKRADLMTVAGLYVQDIKKNKPEKVKLDADGMGAGVVDRLREQGYSIMEIHSGGKPRDHEKFKNLKAEIYWGFRERLLDGNVDLPNIPEIQAQLTSCLYKINSSGQIEIVSKEEMKKKGLVSPDIAEAIIYAFAETAADFGFGVI